MKAKVYSVEKGICIEGDFKEGVKKIICYNTTEEKLLSLYKSWSVKKIEPFHKYLEYFYGKNGFEIVNK